MALLTVGEALVVLLEKAGVDLVFGIPGIHTVELYRGLEKSTIRHITPRHEQGAAFMADGYARATGKPGVCLLITGPGFTNAITAMAQARADSIPMLVITGVNATDTMNKGHGHLHELPDQAALSRTVALWTHTLREPSQLGEILTEAFSAMLSGKPGPVHLEIPIDVMDIKIELPQFEIPQIVPLGVDEGQIEDVRQRCLGASTPLIVIGGGMVHDGDLVQRIAEKLNAPVVSTINARGIMADHLLNVPASPSLSAIRELISASDLVLALGTEMGPTDYDMYGTNALQPLDNIIRVNIDADHFKRRDDKGVDICCHGRLFLEALISALGDDQIFSDGRERAGKAREAAWQELDTPYQSHINLVHALWQVLPDAVQVGDSTQLVYAANMFVKAPGPSKWFNSSTGYGTLGYAPSAAIGAALGQPETPVICLIGDGGMQFSLAELGSAIDCNANVAFIVWNNDGYQEIETAMIASDVAPIGVTPCSPDFVAIATAYNLPALRVSDAEALVDALTELPRPCLIEYEAH